MKEGILMPEIFIWDEDDNPDDYTDDRAVERGENYTGFQSLSKFSESFQGAKETFGKLSSIFG